MNTPWTLHARKIQRITIGLLAGGSLLAGNNSMDAAERRELGANARNQIESLIAEKAARSPSQRKLDSQLIYVLRQSASNVWHPVLTDWSLRSDRDQTGRCSWICGHEWSRTCWPESRRAEAPS
jgi:hypothetical protein